MPRTKKQFRQGLNSTSDCSPTRPLQDESYEPMFRGWDNTSTLGDKLVRHKKQLADTEREVKRNEDILNEFKSFLELLENTACKTKLDASINSLPSFTNDVQRAAEFVTEYTYDSDDELSDVSVDASLHDSTYEHLFPQNDNENIHNDIELPVLDCQKYLCDTKLNLQPVVIVSPLHIPNSNKNSSVDLCNFNISVATNNKKIINSSTIPVKLHEQVLIQNCFPLVKNCNNIYKHIHSRASLDKDQSEIGYEDSNQVQEGRSGNEEHCNTEDKDKFIETSKTEHSSNAQPGFKKIMSHCGLDKKQTHKTENCNRVIESNKNVRHSRSNSAIKEQNKSSVTKEKRVKEVETETDSEDKKDEIILQKFMNAVSEVTTVSQIVSLFNTDFICKFCKKSYIQKHTLRKHLLICPKRNDGFKYVKPKKIVNSTGFTCKLCGAIIQHLRNFDRHNEQRHNLIKPYKCVVCGWGFFNEKLLQHHVMARHGLSLTKHFKCPYCKSAFKRRDDLKYHCRKHKVSNIYICSVCFKTFVDESEGKIHEQSHGYICDVCNFTAPSEEELADHRLTHLQLMTYKCDLCLKTFTMKNIYTRHQRMVHKREMK